MTSVKTTVPVEFAWMKPGVRADYHCVIGQPASQPGVTIREAPFAIPHLRQRDGERWCCFIEEKRGWIACEALSKPGVLDG